MSQKKFKNQIKKKFMNFFKSSAEFLIKFNDFEAITKQLMALITL